MADNENTFLRLWWLRRGQDSHI